jgi:spermidine synthase
VVDLDPAVVALASTVPQLRALNGGSLDDPRVRVLNTDAFGWLRTAAERFDVVVADLPDPDETATAKLYTVEFYALIRSVLAEQGRLVVQSGSPYFAPRSYWSIDASVREAGFATVPYHVDVPSFGDWGFLLATTGTVPPTAVLLLPVPEKSLLPDATRSGEPFHSGCVDWSPWPRRLRRPILTQRSVTHE